MSLKKEMKFIDSEFKSQIFVNIFVIMKNKLNCLEFTKHLGNVQDETLFLHNHN